MMKIHFTYTSDINIARQIRFLLLETTHGIAEHVVQAMTLWLMRKSVIWWLQQPPNLLEETPCCSLRAHLGAHGLTTGKLSWYNEYSTSLNSTTAAVDVYIKIIRDYFYRCSKDIYIKGSNSHHKCCHSHCYIHYIHYYSHCSSFFV